VCEGVDVGQPMAGDVVEQPVILGVDSPWQAAVAKMDTLPTWPTIDCERLTPSVCMLDNRSGIFWLVSPTGQVYKLDWGLLDSSAQPLMFGKVACISLGIRWSELEPCPFQIQKSPGGASDKSHFMTRERLLVQMRLDHATDNFRLKVTIVTIAELYDILIRGVVLYPMETTAYRPGWQSGDGQMGQLPMRFIFRVQLGGFPSEVLASVAGFSGVVTWPGDLLEGNISAIDTLVYEDIEDVSSFVAVMSSSLDVPLWHSSGVLWQDADHLVSQAWHEAFVPVEEEEVPRQTPISGHVRLSPLDITPIAWEYPFEGICVLDLFSGISTSLATVLQVGIPIRKYFYVEKDETAKRVSLRHLALLMRR
jgi:hypothetical protein